MQWHQLDVPKCTHFWQLLHCIESVAIKYSVVVARNGYIRNVVV